mgnify:CR=1 FL=1
MVSAVLQLHCARLCGVEPAVLTRAAEVLALQEAGLPINRLQVRGTNKLHSPLPHASARRDAAAINEWLA